MKHSLHPTSERIVALDIVRGFALLGILLVNMAFFNTPKLFLIGSDVTLFDHQASQVAQLFIEFFAAGKFFTIFSFLFGLGFFLFKERVEAKGLSVKKLYTRRLFFLLVVGFIHSVFLWSGDILLPYAIAGFLLMLFRNQSIQKIKKLAIGLFISVNAILFTLTYLTSLADGVLNSKDTYGDYYNQLISKSISVHQNGSYFEILSFRVAEELPLVLLNLLFVVPLVLSIFLIGLYVGKKGVLKNITEHLDWFYLIWKKSFIYGLILTVTYMLLKTEIITIPFYLQSSVVEVLGTISGLIVSFFYVTSVTLLCNKHTWKKRLSLLAPVGRMALTNYLLQTILCLIIFNGFNLYGKTAPEVGIVITIVIFIAQIIFSHYWFRKYKFGPMEWLWRVYTYQSKPTFK